MIDPNAPSKAEPLDSPDDTSVTDPDPLGSAAPLGNDTLRRLESHGLLPILTAHDVDSAMAVVEALREGGLPAIEITLRSATAEDVMREIRKRYPDVLLAAGTVRDPEQVNRALASGAELIVSPGLHPRVAERADKMGVPLLPGVTTPTEVAAALDLGFGILKFFPAEAAGGTAALRALAGPFPEARFVPIGGISNDRFATYLSLPSVSACGGTWLIRDRAPEQIVERVRAAVAVVRQSRGPMD